MAAEKGLRNASGVRQYNREQFRGVEAERAVQKADDTNEEGAERLITC